MTLRPVSCAFVAGLVSLGAPGFASADSDSCVEDIERGSTRLLFDVTFQLEKRSVSSTAEFEAIHGVVTRYHTFLDSAAVRACVESSKANADRFGAWQRRHAKPVVAQAQGRIDRTCARHTESVIDGAKSMIEPALARHDLRRARTIAADLAASLESDRIVRHCPAKADQVRTILSEYVPGIQAQAAMPRAVADMEAAYVTVAAPWQAMGRALATSGRKAELAPATFETADGVAAYLADADQCVARARALRQLGAKDDLPLTAPTGATVELGAAARLCADLSVEAPNAFGKVSRHNQRVRDNRRKRWERVNIKGFGMEKVYRARGMPLEVTTTPLGVTGWVYPHGDRCIKLKFNARGKAIGRRPLACPAATANATVAHR